MINRAYDMILYSIPQEPNNNILLGLNDVQKAKDSNYSNRLEDLTYV